MNLNDLTKTVIHKTDYSIVEYIHEIPCLRIVNVGFRLGDEVREQCNVILDFMQKRDAGSKLSLLYDVRNAEPILQQDLQWQVTEWKPKVVNLGLKYVAVVTARNEFANLGIDITKEMSTARQSGTTDRFFPDDDSALDWLKEVTKL